MDAPDDQPESRYREFSGDASTSNSVSHIPYEAAAAAAAVEEEEEELELEVVRVDEAFTFRLSEATCSYLSVLLTIWFLVSMTLMFGLYGSSRLRLGPNCSLLIKSNPLFVEYVKVKQLDGTALGPRLYGFYEDPSLDIIVASSAYKSISLPARSQKDYIYFLNEGSQMDITINVESSSSSQLEVAIGEGIEGLAQWLDNPINPNTILSSNIIHGNGMFHQSVKESSFYYVSIINLNSESVEMQLNITLKALIYNTSQAYYSCYLAHDGECSFRTTFSDGNTVVLTTPSTEQSINYDDWYVELSYGPRWITYTVGLGGLAVLIFLGCYLMSCCQHTDNRTVAQYRGMGSDRAPLLSDKDDQSNSSSSDYVCQDDECPDDEYAVDMFDGQLKDGETDINIRRLCGICFDAPRNCFFLPCGHFVACLACGMRIVEISRSCPICRTSIKKVRKLFIV